MDVSRIEAYNPSKINWKNLTAREIIKYSNQGIEVPNVYYQWALNFLNDVEGARNDDVTYQSATSVGRNTRQRAEKSQRNSNGESVNKDDKTTETTDQTSSTDVTAITSVSQGSESAGEDVSEQNLTPAQAKRQRMEDSGKGLRKIAISFTKDSISGAKEARLSAILMKLAEDFSNNEISNLEGEMQEILAKAQAKKNEFKTQISKIEKGSNNLNTLDKIAALNKELQQYGQNGQKIISSSEGVLDSIDGDINSQTPVLFNAKDFGSESGNIGNQLIQHAKNEDWLSALIDIVIGKIAISSGNTAINTAGEGESVQSQALSSSSSNISSAQSLKQEVQNLTGVAGNNKENSANQEDSNDTDPTSGKNKEEDKDIKTSQNDGKDATDKVNIDLNELVKRKIRKGEYAQET